MRKPRPAEKQTVSAHRFETNAFYERVLELRRTNPRDFDSLAPVTKLALGQYESQKREAQKLEAIRDEPPAAA
jgi:hypothetical protein